MTTAHTQTPVAEVAIYDMPDKRKAKVLRAISEKWILEVPIGTKLFVAPQPVEQDAAKLYRWLEYVIRWHDQLTSADVADAKKVLAELVRFKGVEA